MNSPYANLPGRAFWRQGVAERAPLDPGDLYTPKFPISAKARIATAGSCFAQHVGRTLRQAGYNVMDAEPLPANIPDAVANKFGYSLYSARYGNIYTARQLLQLLREATEGFRPANPVWERKGRFYDAFRPSVEPEGLDSRDDVIAYRQEHLEAVRRLLGDIDILVFTFGLTEAWVSRDGGTVYPTAPGTIAGHFDPEEYAFHNFGFTETYEDFLKVRDIVRTFNPKAKFIVTVSPVPLTATASGNHVEVATVYSKSVLRAVCGTLVQDLDDVDYFPSYEVITSQMARSAYYEPNMRSVSRQGVATAMGLFMKAHSAHLPAGGQGPATAARSEEDLICEEALLDAFAK